MNEDRAPVKLLLIDDDELDSRVIERNLKQCGMQYDIDKVVDPELGNDLARTGTYECMLMDYRYPSGNAFEIFHDLLQTPCSQRPPVILMTSMGNEGIAAQSIQIGAQEYLSKAEISPWNLRRMIESACEKGELQRQLEERNQELMKMSFFDSLTGLPNRQLFLDRLGQTWRDAQRSGQGFAVLMMDLDLFKGVNDTLGHDAGDALLQQVGERLLHTVRDSDSVARIGGDEFAAILPAIDGPRCATIVADKIHAAIEESFVISEQLLNIAISVGIAIYPEAGKTAEELLKHADLAMYQAKKTQSRTTLLSSDACLDNREDTIISRDLKPALDSDQVMVFYQPQIRVRDRALVGAEALVRWRHPELGMISPDRFVPFAERSRLIETLTIKVLTQSLRQQALWREQGLDLTVSVNLSARALLSDHIVERILDAVETQGASADHLCLELTETAIMQSPAKARELLLILSESGIRIAIDDFGTGYSSLKYLQQFPFDEIKIDRDFVVGLGDSEADAKIVESVTALGKAFDVQVVAEGVENEQALQHLRHTGCDIVQGYYLGMPMSALEFELWRSDREKRINLRSIDS